MPTKLICALVMMLAADVARAADLGAHGRIGAIFAERPVAVTGKRAPVEVTVIDVQSVRTSPKVPGYYGNRGDFLYQNYYGTPSSDIYGRLPYSCGSYALC